MAGRNEIEILIKARDEATKVLNDVNAKIRELEGSAGGAGSAISNTEGAVASFGSKGVIAFAAVAAAALSAYSYYKRYLELVREGIAAIDDLKLSQASLAAAIATSDPSVPFEKAYDLAGGLVDKIDILDRKFIGTADELRMLADSMTTFGIAIDLSNKKAQDQFVSFGNMIKLITKGQGYQRQVYEEIRSLAQGTVSPHALIATKLEQQGVNVKAMIPLWKEQGTIIENVLKHLSGYSSVLEKMEGQISVQKSSLETIYKKILREGMEEAYKDISGWLKKINDSLYDENGLTERGKELAGFLRDEWREIKGWIELAGTALGKFVDTLLSIRQGRRILDEIIPEVDPFGIYTGGGEAIRRERRQQAEMSALEDFYGAGIPPELKTRPGKSGETDEQKKARESIEKFTERVKESISKYQLEVKNLSETGGDEIDRMLASNHQKWSERLRSIADDKNWKAIPRAMREMLSSLMSEGERFDNIIDLEKKRDAAIESLRKKRTKEEHDAIEQRIKDIARGAELELKGIERQEELEIRLKALRDEAAIPVKWPWNENDVELLQRMSVETTKYAENIRKLDKELAASEIGEGPFMSKEQYEEAFKAYQNAYGAALGRVREETDRNTQFIAKAWTTLFDGLGGEISDLFFDAFKGKLDSLGDYMGAFTDIVRKAWANLIADMITEQLKLSFGGDVKSVFSGAAGLLGGILGGGGGAPTTGLGALEAFYGYKEGGILPGSFAPIRAFADGGIISRPTLGMIGEGGVPEAVIPLKGGKVPVEVMGRDRGAMNININVIAADTKDFDRLLMDRRPLIMSMFADSMRNASGMRDTIRRNI